MFNYVKTCVTKILLWCNFIGTSNDINSINFFDDVIGISISFSVRDNLSDMKLAIEGTIVMSDNLRFHFWTFFVARS